MKNTGRLQQYSAITSQTVLQEIFGINVATDCESTHPPTYCHPCHNFSKKAQKNDTQYNPKKVIATWEKHTESDCFVCSLRNRHQGRPQKKRYTPGRPKKSSPQAIISHIRAISPKPFFQRELLSVGNDDLNCPICLEIVEKPI